MQTDSRGLLQQAAWFHDKKIHSMVRTGVLLLACLLTHLLTYSRACLMLLLLLLLLQSNFMQIDPVSCCRGKEKIDIPRRNRQQTHGG
jgi:hypothetical protein